MNARTIFAVTAFCCTMLAMPSAFAADTLQSNADQREAVLSIAGPTLDAKTGDKDQSLVKFVTFEAAANNGISIASMGLLTKPDQDIALAPATTVLVLFRASAKLSPPSGNDDRFVKKGFLTMIAVTPEKVWEIGKVDGIISVRLFSAGKTGDWQPFQSDPANYTQTK
jgi:hypothetical protein